MGSTALYLTTDCGILLLIKACNGQDSKIIAYQYLQFVNLIAFDSYSIACLFFLGSLSLH